MHCKVGRSQYAPLANPFIVSCAFPCLECFPESRSERVMLIVQEVVKPAPELNFKSQRQRKQHQRRHYVWLRGPEHNCPRSGLDTCAWPAHMALPPLRLERSRWQKRWCVCAGRVGRRLFALRASKKKQRALCSDPKGRPQASAHASRVAAARHHRPYRDRSACVSSLRP